MKSNTQNAKIESITDKTMVIGIDIGSETHYARAFTNRGIELSDKPFSFSNTESGFQEFKAWMEDLMKKNGMEAVAPGMANKDFGNGKATNDNGYGMFTAMLSYKLRERGKPLIKVDKWYPSSQLCSCCGHRQKMPLNVRTYRCLECGTVIDRDVNAAVNIRNEGIRILESA